MRVTHRVKRVPVTLYLAVVQPASRSLGKIGSASIDHASRWDLGRGSSLRSSTNGKTGIHVNGLRGLCRPLPPHSFLLLLLLLFFLFLSRLSFFLSFSSLPSHAHFLFLPCFVFISLFARTNVLSLFLFCTRSLSLFFYFQIRISVIRTASLDETVYWRKSSSGSLLLVSSSMSWYRLPCAGYTNIWTVYCKYRMCVCVCVCIRSLMRFHLKSWQCHARLSTRISYRRIRDNGLGGKAVEYIDGTKWRVGEKKRWQWDSRLVSKSY